MRGILIWIAHVIPNKRLIYTVQFGIWTRAYLTAARAVIYKKPHFWRFFSLQTELFALVNWLKANPFCLCLTFSGLFLFVAWITILLRKQQVIAPKCIRLHANHVKKENRTKKKHENQVSSEFISLKIVWVILFPLMVVICISHKIDTVIHWIDK